MSNLNTAVSPAAQMVESINNKADLTLNMNDLNRAALPSPAYAAAPIGAAQQGAYRAAPAAAAAAGGFRATVPPSPAHGASTAILGSGSHQEMVLPLSEAAPELFGGNPAAATPHYDALAAANPAAPQASYQTAAAPAYAAAAAAPAYASAGAGYAAPMNFAAAAPPSPGAGIRATVPPSPAHAASTAMLGSGSHQEMVLPLSEAAPELFGGNPAASTPHYDAVGEAGIAAPAQMSGAPYSSAAPFVSSAPVTATPMNYAAAASPAYGGVMAAAPPSPGAIRATVPPSPAHAASAAMLGSGSHQEMVLPLSEAAPELFGGNPAASTPHYDAVGEAGIAAGAAPGLAAAAGYMGGFSAVTPGAGPAVLPPVVSSAISATPGSRFASAMPPSFNAAAAPMAAGASQFPHITGFNSVVPPSPAHGASATVLPEGGHQELVLPLSEAAPELFGGNPAAATPHYDAVMGL